jgi:hypothetical protein
MPPFLSYINRDMSLIAKDRGYFNSGGFMKRKRMLIIGLARKLAEALQKIRRFGRTPGQAFFHSAVCYERRGAGEMFPAGFRRVLRLHSNRRREPRVP